MHFIYLNWSHHWDYLYLRPGLFWIWDIVWLALGITYIGNNFGTFYWDIGLIFIENWALFLDYFLFSGIWHSFH